MARPHKPWYRKARNAWFVEIDGQQHNLGPDKEEALRKFHKLMSVPSPEPDSEHLVVILDSFLDWVQEHRPGSYRWYKDYVQSFAKEHPNLLVQDLKPYHVEKWSSKGKGKRGKITAMKRALNWATKMGYIPFSPIASLSRPEVGHRDELITPEDFKELLAHIKDEQFRDLLEFSWDVGARPQESKIIEARHVDIDNEICVIPKEEVKGKKRPRVIYLTDKGIEILKKHWREDGPIFRNTRGRPWTAGAMKDRFARLEKKIGKRYCAYLLRHAWTTRKIVAGVDSHVVARLAGHRDTRMIDLHYSQIAKDHDFLRKQAKIDPSASKPAVAEDASSSDE